MATHDLAATVGTPALRSARGPQVSRRLGLILLIVIALTTLSSGSAQAEPQIRGVCRNLGHYGIGVDYEFALDYSLGPGIWVAERSLLYHYESGTYSLGSPEYQTLLTDPWLFPTNGLNRADRVFTMGGPGHYGIFIQLWINQGGVWYGPTTGEWVTFESGGYWCQP